MVDCLMLKTKPSSEVQKWSVTEANKGLSEIQGVRSFDFLGLGYHVHWPLSVVLTPAALKIYADIFSFLIEVKLAIFSLTDVWCSLKDLMDATNKDKNYELQLEAGHLNILMKMRHQINHFVSTLQQYVESQLSHVSWCRFLHSLEHKVYMKKKAYQMMETMKKYQMMKTMKKYEMMKTMKNYKTNDYYS
ncbi:uncharacterized protein LOC108338515 isoform X3 [Vigna angularis]|uniref:uncharacterized protein LOC108338515 isoform X3 n=1 Tax=Phaseolus angularis TaxID=3914 RepID=UPI0022B3A41B|nr:uncharacterized protein LOC108338515 isoform X3 [Vigna angularis]